MNLKLFHTPDCFQAAKFKAVLQYFKVPFEAVPLPQDRLRRLAGSVYGESPVLVHGARVVEDPGAILRYVDQYFLGSQIKSLSVVEQAEFFHLMEVLDTEILSPLASPAHFTSFDQTLVKALLFLEGLGPFVAQRRLLHLSLFSGLDSLRGQESLWNKVAADEKLCRWHTHLEARLAEELP